MSTRDEYHETRGRVISFPEKINKAISNEIIYPEFLFLNFGNGVTVGHVHQTTLKYLPPMQRDQHLTFFRENNSVNK